MTGIERLRELVDGISPIIALCGVTKSSYDRSHIETVGARLRDFLADIADQIEREQRERVSRVRILAVVTKMERHCLGHEGMEDSPVARWARELREALGATMSRHESDGVADTPYDALRPDDREAIAWVRDHGGIEVLRRMFQDADNRRVELCGALGIDLDKGWSEAMAAMRLRLMPEGMEWLVEAWPRFEDGEPVRLLDDFERYGEENVVSTVTMYQDDNFALNFRAYSKGERVKRPAPKVLDADGAEIREKCDVWWICEGDERGVHAERLRVETICPSGLIECSPYNGGTWVYLEPSELYVNKPVPASDGRPLREGETVWHVKTGREYVVVEPSYGKTVVVRLAKYDDAEGEQHAPDQLTHERPDSWERLKSDIYKEIEMQPTLRTTKCGIESFVSDVVRRCKALAERDA